MNATAIRLLVAAALLVGLATSTTGTFASFTAQHEVGVEVRSASLFMPLNTAAPQVTGLLTVSSLLSSSTGTWDSSQTPAFGRQWLVCDDGASVASCSEIGGQTATSLLLVVGYVGKYVRVRVTATNDAGSRTATSDAVGPVVGL